MPILEVKQVKLKGLACAIPAKVRTLADDEKIFGKEALAKVAKNTGVRNRYIASEQQCTSDLCFAAAQSLLAAMDEPKTTIDALILVTQTPDYILPATSCVLHERLGLRKSCLAFDVNLGCSGYIYGLWLAATMLSNGGLKRILLLAGDTISRILSPNDITTLPLFGDAGTATLLERNENASTPLFFSFGTDGSGKDHLIVPGGGFRQPQSENKALSMNGPEIFSFTLREIPPLVNQLLKAAQWSIAEVDAFIFHQANHFILNHLMNRLKIPREKFISVLSEFGNTSSASIPLAITQGLANQIKRNVELKLLLSGFGVGYSWGGVTLSCESDLILPELSVEQ